MSSHFPPVIGRTEYRNVLRNDPPPVVLEVRRSEKAETVRIQGAVPVHLDTDLQSPGGGARGNRPLPDREQLRKSLLGWGVGDSGVIVYSTDGLAIAARAWLVLRLAGIDVSVLDLGWDSRSDEGVAVVQVHSIEAEDVPGIAESGLLLDARGADSYVGSGNHIPGAVSAPASDLLDDSGRLIGSDALRRHFEGLGSHSEVASYCGGGVAASLEALALASIGVSSSVYVASWSGWTAEKEETNQ